MKEDLLLACELSFPNCGEVNSVPVYKFLGLLPMECNTHKLIMLEILMAFSKTTKLVLPKYLYVATLLWVKWEDETPTPKVEDLESSGTPE